jgi:hypothetical protein
VKRNEITSFTYTSPAASYQPLFLACSNLQKAILKACGEMGLDAAIIGWPTMASDIPDNLKEIRNIQEWLVLNDLIDEPVEIIVTSSSNSQGAILSCVLACLTGLFHGFRSQN